MKDKKWAQREVDRYLSYEGVNEAKNALVFAKGVINQLDEPEVLSQEWIDRFEQFRAYVQEQRDLSYGVELGATGGYTGRIANQYDGLLEMIEEYEEHNPIAPQNLLVPKQELPVIPKYVAEYLDFVKSNAPLMRVLEIASRRDEEPESEKEYDWISYNDETFARAWMDGYEVEKELLYYVTNGANELMLMKKDGVISTVLIPFEFSVDTEYLKLHQLTESEIKDYDERYVQFMEPTEVAE